MKDKYYSQAMKNSLVIAQCVFVALIVLCLRTIETRLDGTFDISQLGRSYEETAVFLRDAENTIRRKVDCSRNIALFQTDGETDLNKSIDIRQYVVGISDEANLNENLTYVLSDLINYYPDIKRLKTAVSSVASQVEEEGAPGDSWDLLAEAASDCETILPRSGSSLASTARASSTPYETLLEYYETLIQVCEDVHSRYRSYVEEKNNPEGSGNPKAPSNLSYYIENTLTKQSYTNLGVNSVATARVAIEEDHELTMLFDGVRTMDIMVANSENTLNDRAASWFMDTVFLGSNERVVVAVDRSYPVGDELRGEYLAYQKREPVVISALIIAIFAAAALAVCFGLSLVTTGRKNRNTLIELKDFDLIPTEIAAGICVIVLLIWIYLSRTVVRYRIPPRFQDIWHIAFWTILYWMCLMSLLSLIRRLKWNRLWTDSVTRTVVQVSAQVLEAKVTSARMLILFVVFMLLNFLFLRFFGTIGVVIVFVLDLAFLLYLIAEQLGKLSVREGLRELSKGKLDYKIDTSSLTGDSLEMAEAVNEMGDGLQEAVDSIVRSERLKAELITNVSHDLKTPLTSIINYVDLLKREDLQNEKAREYVDILDRKSQRLKSLISDLIEASRINSGNVELDMVELDLRAMVQMAAGEFEDRFEELGLKVVFEEAVPGQKLMIQADGSQLWRVLDNLLSNIVKYAKENSQVKIALRSEDGTALAVFENESSEELLKSGEELEERFVRGDGSRSTEGSGLGLSIAGSLTQLMGGSFQVTTEGLVFRAQLQFPLS